MNVYSVNNIVPDEIERISTTIPAVDKLFGHTGDNWGMVRGKITLIGGAAGIGKTRAVTTIAKCMNRTGYAVLVFQGENTKEQYATSVGITNNDDFWVSEERSLEEQLKIVEEYNPDLIIIDSINMMPEFAGGQGAELIVQGSYIDGVFHQGYRQVISKTGSHLLILSQLNKKGETKGRTDLDHLVDTVLRVYPTETFKEDSTFVMDVGRKNRYGPTGGDISVIWKHVDAGAFTIPQQPKIEKESKIEKEPLLRADGTASDRFREGFKECFKDKGWEWDDSVTSSIPSSSDSSDRFKSFSQAIGWLLVGVIFSAWFAVTLWNMFADIIKS